MLRSRTLLLGLDSGPISFMRGEFHMVFASNNIGIEINVEMIRLYAKFSSTHSSAFQSKGLKSQNHCLSQPQRALPRFKAQESGPSVLIGNFTSLLRGPCEGGP